MRLGAQAQQVQPLALQDLQVPSNEARDLPMENGDILEFYGLLWCFIGILWIFVVISWDLLEFSWWFIQNPLQTVICG